MGRVYNFSAGPAVLPEEVLKEAAAEMLDYNGIGMSVMEMTHRSPEFEEGILNAAKETLIKSEIISVISGYTHAEASLSQDAICDEILKRIQAMYGSDFIYKVSFSEFMFG